jgi:hypothetical protein
MKHKNIKITVILEEHQADITQRMWCRGHHAAGQAGTPGFNTQGLKITEEKELPLH